MTQCGDVVARKPQRDPAGVPFGVGAAGAVFLPVPGRQPDGVLDAP